MRQFLVALLSASIATQASAEVVSVEISEQRPWISGREFKAGGYELLSGIVHYEVDPLARSSLGITDIRLAPRNARGKVEFQGPFMMLRPRDPGAVERRHDLRNRQSRLDADAGCADRIRHIRTDEQRHRGSVAACLVGHGLHLRLGSFCRYR